MESNIEWLVKIYWNTWKIWMSWKLRCRGPAGEPQGQHPVAPQRPTRAPRLLRAPGGGCRRRRCRCCGQRHGAHCGAPGSVAIHGNSWQFRYRANDANDVQLFLSFRETHGSFRWSRSHYLLPQDEAWLLQLGHKVMNVTEWSLNETNQAVVDPELTFLFLNPSCSAQNSAEQTFRQVGLIWWEVNMNEIHWTTWELLGDWISQTYLRLSCINRRCRIIDFFFGIAHIDRHSPLNRTS